MVALEDRARRAEETRDETARRRVAEDRVRIARELHDVIAHHVAVMSVQSGVAEHLVERDPAAAREALHRVRAAAKSVLSELQSVLGVLRQDESILPTTPAPGLGDLPGLVESFRAMGASVELVVPERTPALSSTAGVAAFRLVQEALTNVQKHAAGASATVTWHIDGDEVQLSVTNARPPSEHPHSLRAAPVGSGLGLVGMRERVVAAEGALSSGPTAQGGFRVTARLPLTPEDP
jgi:signal transduction histidine kinase